MTPAAFRKLALSLQGVHEEPHFERTSFRVGKKILATMDEAKREAMIVLRPPERALFLLEAGPEVFIDHGFWTRRHGALGMHLAKLTAAEARELLLEAHAGFTRPERKRSSRGRSRT